MLAPICNWCQLNWHGSQIRTSISVNDEFTGRGPDLGAVEQGKDEPDGADLKSVPT